jgi:hypothetical protein
VASLSSVDTKIVNKVIKQEEKTVVNPEDPTALVSRFFKKRKASADVTSN